jgi:hypothetical protein
VDKMEIEIMPDGMIKVSTDAVSAANHMSAEQFLREVARLTGGTTTRTRRGHSHGHAHDHSHGEDHGHEHH